MIKRKVDASLKNLDNILSFLEEQLSSVTGNPQCKMECLVAAEEIFVNICHYAYPGTGGEAELIVTLTGDSKGEDGEVVLEFRDWGIPFNPLERTEPDVKQKNRERTVGGLGIHLVRQIMDELNYEYRDGQNRLKMKKRLC